MLRSSLFVLAFLLISTTLRNEDWQDERRLWRNGQSFRSQMALARSWEQVQRYDIAVPIYRSVALRAGDSAPFHYKSSALNAIAKILIDGEQPILALDYLVQALRINPTMEMAAGNLAVIYMRSGHPDAALKVLDEASVHHPDSAMILFNKAEAMRVLRRCDEANALYEYAQRLYPDLTYVACQ